MRKSFITLVTVFFLAVPAWAQGEAPTQVMGFKLGSQITDYKDRLRMDTALPIRHEEYLVEVEAKKMPRVKSCYLIYANCDQLGKIVRIKLKYANSSKKFYETLLKMFKKQFGEPKEWLGDSFGMVLAWKWFFEDTEGNQISLILQHNASDPDNRLGNSIKFTHSTLMEHEHDCFNQKNPENYEDEKEALKKIDKIEWEELIPH